MHLNLESQMALFVTRVVDSPNTLSLRGCRDALNGRLPNAARHIRVCMLELPECSNTPCHSETHVRNPFNCGVLQNIEQWPT